MESEPLYPYTRRNLLDQPEYYMFSAYHGQSFLRGYFEQRVLNIAGFEGRYLDNLRKQNRSSAAWLKYWKDIIGQNESVFSKDIQVVHSGFLPACDGEWLPPGSRSISELQDITMTVNTEQHLRLLLQISVARDPADHENYLLWLNYFLTRFEVSKKLYTAYQRSSAKKASEEYGDHLNYALLSLTLLYDYEWSGNLKMVNTAIKLNDLLCSLGADLVEPETLLVTILALHKEKNIIRQLMADKQVAI